MNIEKLTGLLLILLPITFNVVFFLLQRNFEYPDILRKPTEYILDRFNAGGKGLIATWYAFTLAAVLFTPAAILMHQTLSSENTPYMPLATTIGVLAGAMQFLGLIRWPFLVPYLAGAFAAPSASQASRDATIVTFESAHRFLGMGIGEHLGYFFTAVWSFLVALALEGSGLVPDALALAGVLPTAMILAGLLEPAGWRPAGAINAIGYLVWSAWLIALGIALLLP